MVDAIVNAANAGLAGGGGVDGAIHAAGGPSILAECREIVAEIGPCHAGGAIITGAGTLSAKHVIHAVGPGYRDGQHGENVKLERAYVTSMDLAREAGARTVAFPSIGTGAYRFPIAEAALIALNTLFRTVRANPEAFDEVRMVLFSDTDFEVYAEAFDKVVRTMLGT